VKRSGYSEDVQPGSEQSLFCHGCRLGQTHDDVIQDADIYESQGVFQPAGDSGVIPAGLGNARGVIVGEDHGRGIQLQTTPDDYPGVHAGSIDGAPEESLEMDQLVAGIEKETAEAFIPLQANLQLAVLLHGSRVREDLGGGQLAFQQAEGSAEGDLLGFR